MSIIDSLVVTLTAEGRTLRDLTVTAAGSDGVSPYTLRLTLTVLTPGTLDTAIPQTVLDALTQSDDIITLRWDPDALPLLRGVLTLAARNDFQAELGMKLECSIFSVSGSLDIQYNSGVRPGIGRLTGGSLECYFSGSKLCTAGGRLLTEYDEVRFDRLLVLALPVLVEGKVESLRSGDSGLYTMPLTQEELDMIASVAASQTAGVSINLTEGTLEARVTDNRLTGVSFTCNGSVTGSVLLLKAEVPAAVTVTLRPAENPHPLVIPDAVRAALGAEN